MENTSLINKWQTVCQQIDDAKITPQQKVCLIAVSKTKPAEMITALVKAGQRDFGENYLQEAIEKMATVQEWLRTHDELSQNSIIWHYIGHIQRNKTKDIAENFDWVHTIEREIIAKRLNNQRPERLGKLNVLIQVNIDEEESKSGCHPDEVNDLVVSIKGYNNLNLRGLMIIPAQENTGAFARTKQLFDTIADLHPELKNWDTLSMGMSADMKDAIVKGSTMVRVGSAIFGARD